MASRNIQVGIAVAAALGVLALFFIFSNESGMDNQNPLNALSQQGTQTQGQLVAQDEAVGTGEEAKAGDTVVVEYTGRLQNGTVFDTSVGKGPLAISEGACPAGTQTGLCFTLGAGQVIPGWDQGVQGMKVGGKRILIIPPHLAYGSQDYGPIPGNSTLVFEVTLRNVAR